MRCSAGALLAAAIAASGCAHPPKPAAPPSAPAAPSSRPSPRPTLPALVPAPAIVELGADGGFTLGAGTVVAAASSDPAVQRAARQLSEWIRRSTGIAIAVTNASSGAQATIDLVVDAQRTTGAEGYELTISPRRVTLAASTPAERPAASTRRRSSPRSCRTRRSGS